MVTKNTFHLQLYDLRRVTQKKESQRRDFEDSAAEALRPEVVAGELPKPILHHVLRT